MFSDSLLTALGGLASLLLLAIALYIYVALVRQINSRASVLPFEPERDLGIPEAAVALMLVLLLLTGTAVSIRAPVVQLDSHLILKSLLVTTAIVLFTALFLVVRGFNLVSLAGLSRIGFLRALATGLVLVVAAYPLMIIADGISQKLLGGGASKQSIVEFFTGSDSIRQRMMIILFAITVAPLIEEFLFRVFLYRVFRRYFGIWFGVFANALLFAVVHAHLPSIAPLFVLGVCLTLGFEWSGSVLVPMTMHALFNASQLAALAFPELFQQ